MVSSWRVWIRRLFSRTSGKPAVNEDVDERQVRADRAVREAQVRRGSGRSPESHRPY